MSAKRERNSNFSLSEKSYICDMFLKHKDVLSAKFSNTVTNARKCEIWEQITRGVNSVGNATRTVKQVRDKWKNLQQTAKFRFSEHKRSQTKTGGGPPPEPLSPTTDRIVETFKDTTLFIGLPGFETTAGPQTEADIAVMDITDVDTLCGMVNLTEEVEVPVLEVEESLPSASDQPTTSVLPVSPAHTSTPGQRRRKITSQDVLQLQYDVLIEEREKIMLEKEKLKMEISKMQAEAKCTCRKTTVIED